MSCTYSRILSSHPAWIVSAAALVSISCLVLVFTVRSLPDFTDPQLGFECRGTVLASRSTAWENLLRASRRTGPLSTNPLERQADADAASAHLKKPGHANASKQQHKKRPNGQNGTGTLKSSYGAVRLAAGNSLEEPDDEESAAWRRASHPFDVLAGREAPNKSSAPNHSHFDWGETVTRSPAHLARQKPVWSQLQQLGTTGLLRTESGDDSDDDDDDADEHPKQPLKNKKKKAKEQAFFFCDQPHAEYAHVVFTPANETSGLWTVEAIHDMCKIDEALRSSEQFPSVCQQSAGNRRGGGGGRRCCPSWSIGSYLALMRNRTSCYELDEQDVRSALQVLDSCAKHYHALRLSAHCDAVLQEGPEPGGSGCPEVPDACSRHNAVYHLLHYLTDAQFLANNSRRLRFASLFLPVARSTALLPYYRSVKNLALLPTNATGARLAAMDFGLKEALFNEYVIRDAVFVCVGAALVCVLMWWYTASLFLTFMSVAAVFLSLAIAYTIYTFVFELEFFPFMNLLAAVILVGIGADDVFVYVQVWRCTKLDKDGTTLAKLVADTLAHAGLSMLVTSLTTASAFFSSFICPVTAVRCFSLFAGLCVTVHFAFMVSWLPASVLLAEKYCSSRSPCRRSLLPDPARRIAHAATDVGRITFDKILPCIVIKLRYFWILLLGALAVAASVVVFYYPKLELPDTKEFQLFSSAHPFERYDLEFKNEFWFERSQRTDAMAKLPLRFVWGVKPEDTGNYLDPSAKGSLVLDPTFNMAAPESQRWLAEFCRNIRTEPFYEPTLGPLLPNCFIETFQSWMQRRCEDAVDRKNRTPCCESSRFPYSEDVFNECILLAVKDLYETPAQFFMPGVAGPRFSRAAPHRIAAVVVEYDSNVSYSLSYQEMHRFYHDVESWMHKQLESAPATMKGGWFTSDLAFYDVQHNLSASTVNSIGLAMLIALAVLVCATGNLWLSFIAVVCLGSVVVVSVAVLVLLGWKLNILESVAVSVAVGLSVDFTLHYVVGYRLSGHESDRESAVVYSLSRMSSPIAMAALTTLLAGAAVLPSSVVAYQQIGTFVVVVMLTSWLYSTLFLPSLLRVLGPQRGCAQIKCPSCASCFFCCCAPNRTRHVDKTVYSHGLSESTVSTSSTTCPNQVAVVQSPNGETHELEPLTSRSKRASRPADEADSDQPNSSTTRRTKHGRLKKNAPVTAALLSTADDDRPGSQLVCVETQNADMWSA